MFNLLIILPFLVTFHVSVFLLFCVCKKKAEKGRFHTALFFVGVTFGKIGHHSPASCSCAAFVVYAKVKGSPWLLCRRFSPLFGSSFPFSDSKLSFSALTMLTQFQTIFYLSDNQTDIYPIWYFYFFSFLFLQFLRDGVFSIGAIMTIMIIYYFDLWYFSSLDVCWQKFILFQIRLYLHISVVH